MRKRKQERNTAEPDHRKTDNGRDLRGLKHAIHWLPKKQETTKGNGTDGDFTQKGEHYTLNQGPLMTAQQLMQ